MYQRYYTEEATLYKCFQWLAFFFFVYVLEVLLLSVDSATTNHFTQCSELSEPSEFNKTQL